MGKKRNYMPALGEPSTAGQIYTHDNSSQVPVGYQGWTLQPHEILQKEHEKQVAEQTVVGNIMKTGVNTLWNAGVNTVLGIPMAAEGISDFAGSFGDNGYSENKSVALADSWKKWFQETAGTEIKHSRDESELEKIGHTILSGIGSGAEFLIPATGATKALGMVGRAANLGAKATGALQRVGTTAILATGEAAQNTHEKSQELDRQTREKLLKQGLEQEEIETYLQSPQYVEDKTKTMQTVFGTSLAVNLLDYIPIAKMVGGPASGYANRLSNLSSSSAFKYAAKNYGKTVGLEAASEAFEEVTPSLAGKAMQESTKSFADPEGTGKSYSERMWDHITSNETFHEALGGAVGGTVIGGGAAIPAAIQDYKDFKKAQEWWEKNQKDLPDQKAYQGLSSFVDRQKKYDEALRAGDKEKAKKIEEEDNEQYWYNAALNGRLGIGQSYLQRLANGQFKDSDRNDVGSDEAKLDAEIWEKEKKGVQERAQKALKMSNRVASEFETRKDLIHQFRSNPEVQDEIRKDVFASIYEKSAVSDLADKRVNLKKETEKFNNERELSEKVDLLVEDIAQDDLQTQIGGNALGVSSLAESIKSSNTLKEKIDLLLSPQMAEHAKSLKSLRNAIKYVSDTNNKGVKQYHDLVKLQDDVKDVGNKIDAFSDKSVEEKPLKQRIAKVLFDQKLKKVKEKADIKTEEVKAKQEPKTATEANITQQPKPENEEEKREEKKVDNFIKENPDEDIYDTVPLTQTPEPPANKGAVKPLNEAIKKARYSVNDLTEETAPPVDQKVVDTLKDQTANLRQPGQGETTGDVQQAQKKVDAVKEKIDPSTETNIDGKIPPPDDELFKTGVPSMGDAIRKMFLGPKVPTLNSLIENAVIPYCNTEEQKDFLWFLIHRINNSHNLGKTKHGHPKVFLERAKEGTGTRVSFKGDSATLFLDLDQLRGVNENRSTYSIIVEELTHIVTASFYNDPEIKELHKKLKLYKRVFERYLFSPAAPVTDTSGQPLILDEVEVTTSSQLKRWLKTAENTPTSFIQIADTQVLVRDIKNALKDTDEFLAFGLAEGSIRDLLQRIVFQGVEGKKSLYDKLVEVLTNFLSSFIGQTPQKLTLDKVMMSEIIALGGSVVKDVNGHALAASELAQVYEDLKSLDNQSFQDSVVTDPKTGEFIIQFGALKLPVENSKEKTEKKIEEGIKAVEQAVKQEENKQNPIVVETVPVGKTEEEVIAQSLTLRSDQTSRLLKLIKVGQIPPAVRALGNSLFEKDFIKNTGKTFGAFGKFVYYAGSQNNLTKEEVNNLIRDWDSGSENYNTAKKELADHLISGKLGSLSKEAFPLIPYECEKNEPHLLDGEQDGLVTFSIGQTSNAFILHKEGKPFLYMSKNPELPSKDVLVGSLRNVAGNSISSEQYEVMYNNMAYNHSQLLKLVEQLKKQDLGKVEIKLRADSLYSYSGQETYTLPETPFSFEEILSPKGLRVKIGFKGKNESLHIFNKLDQNGKPKTSSIPKDFYDAVFEMVQGPNSQDKFLVVEKPYGGGYVGYPINFNKTKVYDLGKLNQTFGLPDEATFDKFLEWGVLPENQESLGLFLGNFNRGASSLKTMFGMWKSLPAEELLKNITSTLRDNGTRIEMTAAPHVIEQLGDGSFKVRPATVVEYFEPYFKDLSIPYNPAFQGANRSGGINPLQNTKPFFQPSYSGVVEVVEKPAVVTPGTSEVFKPQVSSRRRKSPQEIAQLEQTAQTQPTVESETTTASMRTGRGKGRTPDVLRAPTFPSLEYLPSMSEFSEIERVKIVNFIAHKLHGQMFMQASYLHVPVSSQLTNFISTLRNVPELIYDKLLYSLPPDFTVDQEGERLLKTGRYENLIVQLEEDIDFRDEFLNKLSEKIETTIGVRLLDNESYEKLDDGTLSEEAENEENKAAELGEQKQFDNSAAMTKEDHLASNVKTLLEGLSNNKGLIDYAVVDSYFRNLAKISKTAEEFVLSVSDFNSTEPVVVSLQQSLDEFYYWLKTEETKKPENVGVPIEIIEKRADSLLKPLSRKIYAQMYSYYNKAKAVYLAEITQKDKKTGKEKPSIIKLDHNDVIAPLQEIFKSRIFSLNKSFDDWERENLKTLLPLDDGSSVDSWAHNLLKSPLNLFESGEKEYGISLYYKILEEYQKEDKTSPMGSFASDLSYFFENTKTSDHFENNTGRLSKFFQGFVEANPGLQSSSKNHAGKQLQPFVFLSDFTKTMQGKSKPYTDFGLDNVYRNDVALTDTHESFFDIKSFAFNVGKLVEGEAKEFSKFGYDERFANGFLHFVDALKMRNVENWKNLTWFASTKTFSDKATKPLIEVSLLLKEEELDHAIDTCILAEASLIARTIQVLGSDGYIQNKGSYPSNFIARKEYILHDYLNGKVDNVVGYDAETDRYTVNEEALTEARRLVNEQLYAETDLLVRQIEKNHKSNYAFLDSLEIEEKANAFFGRNGLKKLLYAFLVNDHKAIVANAKSLGHPSFNAKFDTVETENGGKIKVLNFAKTAVEWVKRAAANIGNGHTLAMFYNAFVDHVNSVSDIPRINDDMTYNMVVFKDVEMFDVLKEQPNSPQAKYFRNQLVNTILSHEREGKLSKEEKEKLLQALKDLDFGKDSPLKPYNHSLTDAAGGMTPESAIQVLIGAGRIDEQMGIKLLHADEAGDVIRLSKLLKEVGLTFSVFKPIVKSKTKEGKGIKVDNSVYVKNSEEVLWNSLYPAGSPKGALREFMYDNQIHRFCYDTALKEGAVPDKILNFQDVIGGKLAETFNTEDHSYNLPYSDYLMQLHAPVKDKKEVPESIQLASLAFEGLTDDSIVPYALPGNIQKARRAFHDIRGLLRVENYKDLLADYEVNAGVLNPAKVFEGLKKKILTTAKDSNLLASLERNLPIWANPYISKITADIGSLFNKVMQNKMPGFSCIQVPGMHALEGANIRSMTGKKHTVLAYRRDVTATPIRDEAGNLLDYEVRYGDETITPDHEHYSNYWANQYRSRKVQPQILEDGTEIWSFPPQIVVPDFIKNKNLFELSTDGTTVRVRDQYQELLQIFGGRIPSGATTYGTTFEIVGFTPRIINSACFVPSEVALTMGSDYDVDKLMFYRLPFTIDETGNLLTHTDSLPLLGEAGSTSDTLTEEQLQALLVRGYIGSSLVQGDSYRQTAIDSLDTFKEVADPFRKRPDTLLPRERGEDMASFSKQTTMGIINDSGLNNVGPAALFRSFLDKAFTIVKEDRSLTKANYYEAFDPNYKATGLIIKDILSSAVDNAKDPILGEVGIDDVTEIPALFMASLSNILEHNGYGNLKGDEAYIKHLEVINKYFNHPVVARIINEYRKVKAGGYDKSMGMVLKEAGVFVVVNEKTGEVLIGYNVKEEDKTYWVPYEMKFNKKLLDSKEGDRVSEATLLGTLLIINEESSSLFKDLSLANKIDKGDFSPNFVEATAELLEIYHRRHEEGSVLDQILSATHGNVAYKTITDLVTLFSGTGENSFFNLLPQNVDFSAPLGTTSKSPIEDKTFFNIVNRLFEEQVRTLNHKDYAKLLSKYSTKVLEGTMSQMYFEAVATKRKKGDKNEHHKQVVEFLRDLPNLIKTLKKSKSDHYKFFSQFKVTFDNDGSPTLRVSRVEDQELSKALYRTALNESSELVNGKTITEWVGLLTDAVFSQGLNAASAQSPIKAIDFEEALRQIEFDDYLKDGIHSIITDNDFISNLKRSLEIQNGWSFNKALRQHDGKTGPVVAGMSVYADLRTGIKGTGTFKPAWFVTERVAEPDYSTMPDYEFADEAMSILGLEEKNLIPPDVLEKLLKKHHNPTESPFSDKELWGDLYSLYLEEKNTISQSQKTDIKIVQKSQESRYKTSDTVEVIDVTSRGGTAFKNLSPFTKTTLTLPNGEVYETSVEAVWQGLKIIDGKVDMDMVIGKKPAYKRKGNISGHLDLQTGKTLKLVEARNKIYIPLFDQFLKKSSSVQLLNNIQKLIEAGKEIILVDFDTNEDVSVDKPLSHASLIKKKLQEQLESYYHSFYNKEEREEEEHVLYAPTFTASSFLENEQKAINFLKNFSFSSLQSSTKSSFETKMREFEGVLKRLKNGGQVTQRKLSEAKRNLDSLSGQIVHPDALKKAAEEVDFLQTELDSYNQRIAEVKSQMQSRAMDQSGTLLLYGLETIAKIDGLEQEVVKAASDKDFGSLQYLESMFVIYDDIFNSINDFLTDLIESGEVNDPKYEKEVKTIQQKYAEGVLKVNRLNKIVKNLQEQAIKEDFYKRFKTENWTSKEIEEALSTANLRSTMIADVATGINVSEHPVLASMYDMWKRLETTARVATVKFLNLVTPLVKQYEQTFGDNYEVFWEKDVRGRKTGLVIGYESAAYQEFIEGERLTFNQTLKEFEDNNVPLNDIIKLKQAFNLYQFITHDIYSGGTTDPEYQRAYEESLKKYDSDLTTLGIQLQNQINMGTLTEAQAKDQIAKFEAQYSPQSVTQFANDIKTVLASDPALSALFGASAKGWRSFYEMTTTSGSVINQIIGKSAAMHGQYKNIPSMKYVVKVPVEQFHTFLGESVVNQDYLKVMSDPLQRQFYEAFINKLYEVKTLMGVDVTRDFKINHRRYIPELSKSTLSNIRAGNWKGIKDNAEDWFRDFYSSHPTMFDPDSALDPVTKRPIKALTKYMLSGKVDPEALNHNLSDVMIAFNAAGELYQSKSLAQPFLELSKNYYGSLRDPKSNQLAAHSGKFQKVEYFVEAITQNKLKTKKEFTKEELEGKKKQLTTYEKVRIKEIDKELEEFNETLKKIEEQEAKNTSFDNAVANSVLAGNKERVIREIAELEQTKANMGRITTFDDVLNGIISWVQLKALGFNATAAIADFLQNAVSGVIHYAGNPDEFGIYLDSWVITMKEIFKGRAASSPKLHMMNKMFGVEQELGDIVKDTEASLRRNTLDTYFSGGAFSAMKFSDKMNKYPVLITVMRTLHATDINGEMIINPNTNEPYTYWDLIADDGSLVDVGVEVDFGWVSRHYQEVVSKNFGDYDSQNPIPYQKNVLYRALFMFKRWVASQVLARFGTARKNYVTGTEFKGRYRSLLPGEGMSLAEHWKNVVFTACFSSYMADKMGFYKDSPLSRTDRENVLRCVAEAQIMLGLATLSTLLGMLLKGMDDEEKEDAFVLNGTLNSINRLQQELIMWNMGATNNFDKGMAFENVVPLLRTFGEVGSLTNALVDDVVEDDEKKLVFRSGPKKGQDKTHYYLRQLLPGVSQYNTLSNYFAPRDKEGIVREFLNDVWSDSEEGK